MAVLALTDAVVTINSVTLSDHVKSVELSIEAEQLDPTAMGSTYKSALGGLKSGTLSLTFNQDFAASNVDATLFAALGTVVTFAVKATSAANSATNPQYTGSILIAEHKPLANAVGELAEVSVSFPTSGAITRAVS